MIPYSLTMRARCTTNPWFWWLLFLALSMLLIACQGPVGAEVAAGIAGGIAVVDQMLASNQITPEQHKALVESLQSVEAARQAGVAGGLTAAGLAALRIYEAFKGKKAKPAPTPQP